MEIDNDTLDYVLVCPECGFVSSGQYETPLEESLFHKWASIAHNGAGNACSGTKPLEEMTSAVYRTSFLVSEPEPPGLRGLPPGLVAKKKKKKRKKKKQK